MIKYIIQGLLLGFAYVAPIGMQNLYVINTALRESKLKALQVALITIFFDISLALSCFWGIGLLIDKFPLLKGAILLIGSGVVIYIGIGLIRSASDISKEVKIESSLIKVGATCFAVTWLNPQALIDGSLLLGGYHASIPSEMLKFFIFGVCSASFLWFTSLAAVVSIFKAKFNSKILKYINLVCGIIIIFFGIKLGYAFIKLITAV